MACKITVFNCEHASQVPEVPHQNKVRDADSLRYLLVALVQACCKALFDLVPVAIIDRIITCCALFALVTPLLLWVSWSKTGFFIIIGTASACVGVIWILVWLYPEDPY